MMLRTLNPNLNALFIYLKKTFKGFMVIKILIVENNSF